MFKLFISNIWLSFFLQSLSSFTCRKSFNNADNNVTKQQHRNLSVHEYIAIDMLRDAGINVPKGGVARSPDEAFKVAKSIGEFLE